jgi:hypothetical protein
VHTILLEYNNIINNKRVKMGEESYVSIHDAPDWQHSHAKLQNNLYSSLNTIRMIKSKRMRWVAHVAHMGKMIKNTKFLFGSLNRRDYPEYLCIHERMILK